MLLFRNIELTNEHSSYPVTALLCVAVLLAARPLSISVAASPQPNLKTIRFLRSFDLAIPINVLEAEGGYGIYVGKNYNRIAEYDKRLPFGELLVKKSIDMIVLSDRLSKDVRFRDDPQWHSFINGPSSFGFTRVEIPNVDKRSLFVRKQIIEATRRKK